MSTAMRACVLARLDARVGTWVQVADLAAHFGCRSVAVCAELEAMVGVHLVDVHRAASTGLITEATVVQRRRGQAGAGVRQ